MTPEEKELLLKVLCEQLPYGVKCDRYGNSYKLVDIDIERKLVYLLRDEQYVPYSILRGDIIKPYLRPMSSMTEEEVKEFAALESIDVLGGDIKITCVELSIDAIDWLNKKMFDYRGLISKGLALEAPEGMYN